jgi:hypothetical protein
MLYLQYKSYGTWWTGPSSRSTEFRFLLRRSICPMRVLDHGKIVLEFF